MRRTTIAVMMLTALGLALAAPALAQEDYPPGVLGEVQLSDATIVCPAAVTVSGSGWEPFSTVAIVFGDEQIGSAEVDATTEFSTEVTIPADTPGDYTLFVQGNDATSAAQTEDTRVSCVEESGGEVAFTGANITVGLLVLFGLVVVGVSALVAGRRKTRVTE